MFFDYRSAYRRYAYQYRGRTKRGAKNGIETGVLQRPMNTGAYGAIEIALDPSRHPGGRSDLDVAVTLFPVERSMARSRFRSRRIMALWTTLGHQRYKTQSSPSSQPNREKISRPAAPRFVFPHPRPPTASHSSARSTKNEIYPACQRTRGRKR